MALIRTYSRRKRASSGETPDVFRYDVFPEKLRNQIVQILQAAIGPYVDGGGYPAPREVYDPIVDAMREELGVFNISGFRNIDKSDELFSFLANHHNIDELIDAIELSLVLLDTYVGPNAHFFKGFARKTAEQAISEFNERLMEAGIGYQFVSGNIVRVDSFAMHSEIVLPALVLLSEPGFEAANSEYLSAHEHYRHRDFEPCLMECAKSFESVLKIISAARGWGASESDTSSRLIQAAVDAGFLNNYLQAGFTSLRSMLESGVPVPRNKSAGHGAGTTQRTVPAELAAFQLHQTGAAILFLVESHKAQP